MASVLLYKTCLCMPLPCPMETYSCMAAGCTHAFAPHNTSSCNFEDITWQHFIYNDMFLHFLLFALLHSRFSYSGGWIWWFAWLSSWQHFFFVTLYAFLCLSLSLTPISSSPTYLDIYIATMLDRKHLPLILSVRARARAARTHKTCSCCAFCAFCLPSARIHCLLPLTPCSLHFSGTGWWTGVLNHLLSLRLGEHFSGSFILHAVTIYLAASTVTFFPGARPLLLQKAGRNIACLPSLLSSLLSSLSVSSPLLISLSLKRGKSTFTLLCGEGEGAYNLCFHACMPCFLTALEQARTAYIMGVGGTHTSWAEAVGAVGGTCLLLHLPAESFPSPTLSLSH